jgi:hypothetical protein
MRHVTWILHLYPGAWRKRYEEEMVALLELHTVTLATFFDLLLGALDARLDPSYKTEKALFLFKDERMIATTFLSAYAIFLLTMYNWHHYIPLALSLTPFYMNLGMLSTQTVTAPSVFSSSTAFTGVTGDSLLALSELVMQVTLLASNIFFIALFVKQAQGARKRFVLPAALCLFLLFALPLVPLLRFSASTVSIDNPARWSVEAISSDQMGVLYLWSFRLLWPSLTLLISSLFIAMIKFKDVMAAPRKQWLVLAVMFYLILPLSRLLWLYESVQIPSSILPISSVVLGAVLTYFPPFAALGALLVVLANHEGSRRMWRVALVPATVLSLVMLVKLIMTVVTLSLIWSSMLRLISPWNNSLAVFTFTATLPVMFIAGAITLITLMRGFIALKTDEPYAQTDATALLQQ